jgi:hypothetical protein
MFKQLDKSIYELTVYGKNRKGEITKKLKYKADNYGWHYDHKNSSFHDLYRLRFKIYSYDYNGFYSETTINARKIKKIKVRLLEGFYSSFFITEEDIEKIFFMKMRNIQKGVYSKGLFKYFSKQNNNELLDEDLICLINN